MTKTMSKKQNRGQSSVSDVDKFFEKKSQIDSIDAEATRIVRAAVDTPKPRRYTPPQCSSCTAAAEGKGYTQVYCMRRESGYTIRYLRCEFCRHTFKDIEKN